MKTLLITCAFVFISLFSYSQTIYQIRADSVRIYNTCDTAELILENRTQNVAGFLYNKGKGRTEFRKLTFDSTLIFSAYKNNTAGDSVLTTDANGVVKFVHKSTLGGGGGLLTLQQVTDTGNATTNQIRITGQNRIPTAARPALELGLDTSTEYYTQGPLGTIRVRDRNVDEWGYDNAYASYLSLDAKGLVVENKLQNQYTRGLITSGGPDIYYGQGFTILAQQRADENSFWTNDAVLSLQGGLVRLGTSTAVDGPIGYTAIQTSWGTQNQNIGPSCYTYLLIHNAPVIHLPPAGMLAGRVIFVKRTLTGNYQTTIDVEDGGKIDNATSTTITNYLTSIQFQSDGTNWWILSRTGN